MKFMYFKSHYLDRNKGCVKYNFIFEHLSPVMMLRSLKFRVFVYKFIVSLYLLV